jgi:predicted phosphoribosyltransferase
MDTAPYFLSRSSVGQDFAKELAYLRYENTAVLSLSPGGVVIAIEIAKQLHSITAMLLLKHVHLPGEINYGVINDRGGFTYDNSISIAQAEEFKIEYRNAIDQEKMEAIHKLHMIGNSGELKPSYFNGRHIIIVNDITKNGTSFQAAVDYLKPTSYESLTLVAAVASEQSTDIMHKLGDKVLIAHKTVNDFPSSHYFTNDIIPQSDELIKMIEQIILQW